MANGAFPTRSLNTAVLAAVVIFLCGSLVHAQSLYGYRALGSLTYKLEIASPIPSNVLMVYRSQVAWQQHSESSSTTTEAGQTTLPAKATEPAAGSTASLPTDSTPAPDTTLATAASQAPSTSSSPTSSSSTTSTDLKAALLAATQPSAASITSPGADDSGATAEAELIGGSQDLGTLESGAFAEVAFSLNVMRSTYNCTSATTQQQRFCKFLANTVGGAPYYKSLSTKNVWKNIALPRTILLQLSYLLAHVLLLGAVIVFCAPLMSLTGHNKRLIGSTLLDGAAAIAGMALAWQRWMSISVPDTVHNALNEHWPGLLTSVQKQREPSPIILVMSGVLWAGAASIMALEWILHSRDNQSSRRSGGNGSVSRSSNAGSDNALDDEEISLLLNPPR